MASALNERPTSTLQDWCERSSVATSYIDPGAPWQNAWVESFNARFRDEVLNCEIFSSLLEAQVISADWRDLYNRLHPHSALQMKAPSAFAAWWKASHEGELIA